MNVWFREVLNSAGQRTVSLRFQARSENMFSERCAQDYAYILDQVSKDYPGLDAPETDPFEYGQSRRAKSYNNIGFIVSLRPEDNFMGVMSEYEMNDTTLLEVEGRWVDFEGGRCTISATFRRTL